MNLMGIEDEPKPSVKHTVESLKLPPLEKPAWFNRVIGELMEDTPPMVGPQVSWSNVGY